MLRADPFKAAGIALFVLLGARAAHAEGPLRLEDAVSLALSRNEAAKIADFQVTVAEAAVETKRAAFLPTITVNGIGTQRPYSDKTQASTTGVTNAVITQPLLNAAAWPLYRQAERLLDAQRASTVDQKRLLAFTAASAFMQALQVEQVLQAGQRSVDAAKANLADTQARVDAQLNSSNDVTRAQVDLASVEQQVANSTGNVERAYIQLSFIINAPIQGPLQPPSQTLQAAAAPLGRIDSLIGVAEQRRPDLVAARHATRAAELFADEPMLRLVPTISLAGTLTGSAASGPQPARSTDEFLTATATWTLYDAGVRYADKHSRDASFSISSLQVDLLERSIANDVRTAAASLAAAQAAFVAAGQGVEASRRNVAETAVLYRQGLAKAIELTDANDSRLLAETTYAEAEFSMAQAYLALRQAMGLDPLGKELK